jgi:hypothetical protein
MTNESNNRIKKGTKREGKQKRMNNELRKPWIRRENQNKPKYIWDEKGKNRMHLRKKEVG